MENPTDHDGLPVKYHLELVKFSVVLYLTPPPPVTSRSPKNQVGMMIEDALFTETFIHSDCVPCTRQERELCGLARLPMPARVRAC